MQGGGAQKARLASSKRAGTGSGRQDALLESEATHNDSSAKNACHPDPGIIVYSLARCCSASSESLGPGRELVDVHRGFVTDSIHLFVLFYANLIVLSTHLPQEMLKLLPLLAAFFALARLIYWGTSAMSSTFRGFGYGLTFFPIVGLLVANLCYMFVLGPDKMFATSASGSEGQEEASGPRQRFWG
ncbi:transmembrane protein 79-like [Carcharodon carcharias]|uniref:transmembrane protein 79-like n=1 Tax=Carcharodon carcharias TaxID=13397 RepID=UPI001B7EDE75|nr:transmembrane protein 79-like [Carcharodon carcharias]